MQKRKTKPMTSITLSLIVKVKNPFSCSRLCEIMCEKVFAVCVRDLGGATWLSGPPEKWLDQTGTLSCCHDTQPVTSGYSQGRHTAGTAKKGAPRLCQAHRESAWHHFPLKRHILPLLLAAEREREGWGCFRSSGRLAVRPNWYTHIPPSVNEL